MWTMLFRIIHSKFRGARLLLQLIVPIKDALTNYRIKRHPLRREPAWGSLMGDGSDAEFDDGNRAHRLWRSRFVTKTSAIAINQISWHARLVSL
jgi:hypothetical protein